MLLPLPFSLHPPGVVKLLVAHLQQLEHLLVVRFDGYEMLELLVLAVQLVSDVNHFWLGHWCALESNSY